MMKQFNYLFIYNHIENYSLSFSFASKVKSIVIKFYDDYDVDDGDGDTGDGGGCRMIDNNDDLKNNKKTKQKV